MSAKWKKKYPPEVQIAAQRLAQDMQNFINLNGASVARVERELGWTRGFLEQKFRRGYRLDLHDLISVIYAFTDSEDDLYDAIGQFLAQTFPESVSRLKEKTPGFRH